jgi:hypothetical protein
MKTASGTGLWVADHKGNHQEAIACSDGRQQSRLLLQQSGPLTGPPSVQSCDPQRLAMLPLQHCLWIDAVAFSKCPLALFTMLYRSTDCLSCRGAPMKNLAHNASFHSTVKIAPSNAGTEQLTLKLNNKQLVSIFSKPNQPFKLWQGHSFSEKICTPVASSKAHLYKWLAGAFSRAACTGVYAFIQCRVVGKTIVARPPQR